MSTDGVSCVVRLYRQSGLRSDGVTKMKQYENNSRFYYRCEMKGESLVKFERLSLIVWQDMSVVTLVSLIYLFGG